MTWLRLTEVISILFVSKVSMTKKRKQGFSPGDPEIPRRPNLTLLEEPTQTSSHELYVYV